MRIVFSALGAATLVYGALVAASLAGGPLKPQQLLPFPDLVNNLPVLDPQPTAAKPGAKSTLGENRPVGAGAKKINTATASASPVAPSASAAPSTAAPSADPTKPPATPQPSADPTKPPATPQPSATPALSATPAPGQTPAQSGNIAATAGAALPIALLMAGLTGGAVAAAGLGAA